MSSAYRVLITDRAWPDCEVEREILRQVDAEVVDAPSSDEATLTDLARDVDAIATCWAQVTSSVIDACPRCRVISRFGIGLDNIAVPTATDRRIPVTYVPDYCIPEVSSHTLALILACARKVPFFHHRAKQGEYSLQAGPAMHRLSCQTLGLVGFGRIGRSVFQKATAIGFHVIAFSPSGNDYGTGCRMVTFEELLPQSDFISLHLPLTNKTHRMFDLSAFRRMKSTASLINTSRGGLLDHSALQTALEQNELAGVALDVFEPEPPDLSQPLFQDDRVIVTPHAAFLSAESLLELRTRTAQQVADVLQHKRPEHVVNPEIYDKSS